jgi:hypothetical protein
VLEPSGSYESKVKFWKKIIRVLCPLKGLKTRMKVCFGGEGGVLDGGFTAVFTCHAVENKRGHASKK